MPAPAPVRHVSVVSEDPVDYTPHVLDGIVNAIAIVGRTVVVGGEFSAVKEARPQDAPALERANLFAFDLYTGKILPSFAPEVRGVVYALAAGADGTVYVGGDFATIGRAPARGLARLRVADGAPVPGFEPRIAGGGVQTLAVQGGKVYAGGDFRRVGNAWRTGLARLDAATGAVDPSFAIEVAGPRPGAGLKVYSLAVTPTRLAVDGNFTTLDGQSRPQLGLIDIGGAKARVLPWRTEAYAPACAKSFPAYVRGLAFSPAGDYFVVVTTGGNGGAAKLCDSAARFETGAKGERIKPTWVNHTGGDSLYSVAVTGAAVYVGGHQRWLDNPRGHDSAGPGAVKRTGIGAIDPRTGKALPWNPTRTRGIGVKAFLAHPGGLLVGSDTTRLGREYHARVGMFPLG
ncbi:delta-60 repeat domain-containing protein [Thermocatellispora tengchongensis]|uniref:delta-60 repeat domain-containing protein n=1 Tax=Thermocatellispora tengchongensis TaxID=1073253 RepID=UPI00363A0A67